MAAAAVAAVTHVQQQQQETSAGGSSNDHGHQGCIKQQSKANVLWQYGGSPASGEPRWSRSMSVQGSMPVSCSLPLLLLLLLLLLVLMPVVAVPLSSCCQTSGEL
jgi:hypothetical protein